MNNYLPKVIEENVLKIDDFKIHYYVFDSGAYVFDAQDIELFFLQADNDNAQEYLLRAITTLLNAVEDEKENNERG